MKIFSKKTFLCLLLVSSSQLLNANSSIDDFLLVKSDDITNPSPSQRIEQFYKDNQFHSSFIEKARVTLGNSHFSHMEHDYAIRLYTKGFSEVENEETIYNLEKKLSLGKNHIYQNKLLKNRYEILIDTMYQNRLLLLNNDELSLQQKNLEFAHMLVEKESDVINIYDIKENINNLNLKKFKLEKQYDKLLQNIQLILPSKSLNNLKKEINEKIFLNPYRIIHYISHKIVNNSLATKKNLLLKNNAYQLELAKEKVRSVKIQNNIKLDNVELKYDDSKKRKNAFSFGLSVEIPIAENNSKLMNEKLKLLTLQNKTNESKNNLQNRISELKINIKYLIKYFTKIDNQIDTNDLTSGNNYYTAKLLLKIKKRNIKLEKAKAKTFYQLMQQYITLLYITDTLENSNLKDIIQNLEAS